MRILTIKNGTLARIVAISILVSMWVFFSSPDLSYSKSVDLLMTSQKPSASVEKDSTMMDSTQQSANMDMGQREESAVGENARAEKNSTNSEVGVSDVPEKKALKKVVGSIMPSMPDQEAKEALGRASWKYLHTLLARFPDKPTEEERAKLTTFIGLYAELYPCGECSFHLQKMIKKFPVQTSSRTSAAMWGCHIHNMVNMYLKKAEYDCATILEDYDCGCGDDEKQINLNKVSVKKEEKQLG